MSELDEFKATYFDECTELLSALEEEFAEIEEGDRSTERLNAVFRAIHSVKGGAGAFGFNKLVEFAHEYETLLDHVRNGEVELTDEVVTLCIRANDLVADYVGAARDGIELGADHGSEELDRFKAITLGDDDGEPLEEFDIEFVPVMVDLGHDGDDASEMNADLVAEDDAADMVVETPAVLDVVSDDAFAVEPMSLQPVSLEPVSLEPRNHFVIKFHPHAELYQRANDPLLLFRELMTLGEFRIEPEIGELPGLASFEPFGTYCAWTIYLDAPVDVDESKIADVFEFVDGDCDLSISIGEAQIEETEVEMTDVPESKLNDCAEAAVSAADLDGFDLTQITDAGTELSVAAEPEVSTSEDADVINMAVVANDIEEDDAFDVPSFADLAAEIEPVVKPEAPAASKPTETADASSDPKAAVKPAAGQSIRVDLEKVDRVVNMVGELVIAQSMLTQQMDDHLKARYQELVRGVEVLAQTTRGLQDSVMAIRAQPVKSVFSRMPRLVRELAAKTGKKIRLEMEGEHTEIDKTIIEQLSDPLTHMIRNSADHGVESIEKRLAAGKSEFGTVTISAVQAGGNIVIAVQDDGAGINRERVLALAREREVVGPDQQLSDEQIDELIFAPGFSTADEVSDISGRGVGMDVVISNIKKIGGSVHVKSWPGNGTRVQLRLPLTLAVLDVMLVSVGGSPYVVPLSSIVETIQTRRAEFGHAPSGSPVMRVRGEYVQVIDLAKSFDMPTDVADEDRFVVLCEHDGRSHIALMVDNIIGQQQVVIKSLEENFERIPGIAGGTILGDGSVALIVDVQGLNIPVDHKSAA